MRTGCWRTGRGSWGEGRGLERGRGKDPERGRHRGWDREARDEERNGGGREEGGGGGREEETKEREVLAESEECRKVDTDNSQELFINNLPSPSTFRYLDN